MLSLTNKDKWNRNQKTIDLRRFLLIQMTYLGCGLFLFFSLYYLRVFNILPNETNLMNWDAGWYKSIVDKGYIHHWFEASNTAFFPLFPYLWKISFLGSIGISILNYVLFSLSLYCLFVQYKFSSSKTLLFISIPSSIFFFLPYTESLFFVCGMIFLVGLKKDNLFLIFSGLILCSLTRATAMFFIPSIIIMELFYAKSFVNKRAWRNVFIYSFASLVGFFAVVLFQYSKTGVWFGFAKQQIRYWHHGFSFPGFPIISHGYNNVLWLDGLSLFVGFICTAMLFYCSIKFLMKKFESNYTKGYWFSVTFIFMITVYSLFFNVKSFDGSTLILSMNRYLFATPFFCLFFLESFQTIVFSKKNIFFIFVIGVLTWISLGLGGPVQFLDEMFKSQLRSGLFFLFISFYLTLYFLTESKNLGKYVSGVLFIINLFFTCFVFHTFISSKWVA